ncbi:hypothetical protein D3C81_2208590 [compost metagenome]
MLCTGVILQHTDQIPAVQLFPQHQVYNDCLKRRLQRLLIGFLRMVMMSYAEALALQLLRQQQ